MTELFAFQVAFWIGPHNQLLNTLNAALHYQQFREAPPIEGAKKNLLTDETFVILYMRRL